MCTALLEYGPEPSSSIFAQLLPVSRAQTVSVRPGILCNVVGRSPLVKICLYVTPESLDQGQGRCLIVWPHYTGCHRGSCRVFRGIAWARWACPYPSARCTRSVGQVAASCPDVIYLRSALLIASWIPSAPSSRRRSRTSRSSLTCARPRACASPRTTKSER